MRPVTAVRRMTLAIIAAGAVMLIPACGVPAAHDSASRPAARGSATARPARGTHGRAAATGAPARRQSSGTAPDAALAAALAPVVRGHQGKLAVGVIDQATGVTAAYHPRWPFDTASIIKADILAVLLLQHQQIGAALSPAERQLAPAMIEDSDNDAAATLWNAVEAGPGVEAGNAVLGLRDTWPSVSGAWGLTTTTIADELQLLTDFTSAHSPLSAACRAYELSLMRRVEVGQNWGVTAAADPGTRPAVKNGWPPTGPAGQWAINSIGVVTHAGQRLLIAVLSDGQQTQESGIRQVQAAARAAALAVTGRR